MNPKRRRGIYLCPTLCLGLGPRKRIFFGSPGGRPIMHPAVDQESNDEALDRAARIMRPAHKVAVLTGAGISAESGLATFRGGGGLWEGHRVEDVATPRAVQRDPALVWR